MTMLRERSIAICLLAGLAVAAPALAQRAAPSGALPRIRQNARINLGYSPDARPFAFRDASGGATGYSVALCQKVADAVQAELGLAQLRVEWVPVTLADRFTALQQGRIDVLCGADTETLERRREVAFSIPIFPGGIGALLRADASTRLKDILSGKRSTDPNWRAQAGQLLSAQVFTVVSGTTAEPWLSGKQKEFRLTSKVMPVDGYDAGVQRVLERKAQVFFGDRAILLDAMTRNPSAKKLALLDRVFTHESLALGLARGDEDLRLVVDRTLSQLYASGDVGQLYRQWFGELDDHAITFFQWNTLPN